MRMTESTKSRGRQPWLNRAMHRLLRSPFSRLVDGTIMALTIHGRRTGRPYTFPVQYVQRGDVLWVYVGSSDEKTWWRNLERESQVRVLLRGRMRHGRAIAYTHDRDPSVVEEGLRQWVDRFPGIAMRLGIPPGDDEPFAAAALRTTIVQVRLER